MDKKKGGKVRHLEEEAAELRAEGVHLLRADFVLLLPQCLPLVLILDEPRPQLAHLDRPKRWLVNLNPRTTEAYQQAPRRLVLMEQEEAASQRTGARRTL
jgi:hypothetical protein